VDVEKYAPITTAWNRVTIPLKDFAEYGVDLTHLSELQVVFEWERMSGTIYLDDIRFGSATASSALPVVTGTNAGVGTMKKAASRPNGRSIQR
jgi:hypothetical protein